MLREGHRRSRSGRRKSYYYRHSRIRPLAERVFLSMIFPEKTFAEPPICCISPELQVSGLQVSVIRLSVLKEFYGKVASTQREYVIIFGSLLVYLHHPIGNFQSIWHKQRELTVSGKRMFFLDEAVNFRTSQEIFPTEQLLQKHYVVSKSGKVIMYKLAEVSQVPS